jgi:hypothetical protein
MHQEFCDGVKRRELNYSLLSRVNMRGALRTLGLSSFKELKGLAESKVIKS